MSVDLAKGNQLVQSRIRMYLERKEGQPKTTKQKTFNQSISRHLENAICTGQNREQCDTGTSSSAYLVNAKYPPKPHFLRTNSFVGLVVGGQLAFSGVGTKITGTRLSVFPRPA